MPQLKPVQLEDGTIIYMEVAENVNAPDYPTQEQNYDEYDEDKPRSTYGGAMESAVTGLNSIKSTIQSFTNTTLGAFREISGANINKVTLEFGVKIGGEAGIPYVTKGTAESNVKIIVECSFPKED